MTTITIRRAVLQDRAAIVCLLTEAGLPTVDLPVSPGHFLVAVAGDGIAGTAGLEIYGNTALLRSFAVQEQYRSRNIGQHLYDSLIELALQEGVDRVFLITTSADHYFERRGFERISRNTAPDTIRQTRQFSEICSTSGIVMKKNIRTHT